MELICTTINLKDTFPNGGIDKVNIKMKLLSDLINSTDVCFLQNVSNEMLESLSIFGDTFMIHSSQTTGLLLRRDSFTNAKVVDKRILITKNGTFRELQNMEVPHLEVIYLTVSFIETKEIIIFASTCYGGEPRTAETNLKLYEILVDHLNEKQPVTVDHVIVAGGFNVSSDELSIDNALHIVSHSDFLKGIDLHLMDYFLVSKPRQSLKIEPYIFNCELLRELNIFNKWELSRYIRVNPSLLKFTFVSEDQQ